ncbi:hypothetical protein, partial [Pseudomonas aeruginosa]|uniref:hypothetical protein n=2 Tax=Pseudomonas aeruginosa TaxID=287 RepID=UPI0022390F44
GQRLVVDTPGPSRRTQEIPILGRQRRQGKLPEFTGSTNGRGNAGGRRDVIMMRPVRQSGILAGLSTLFPNDIFLLSRAKGFQ